MGLAPPAASPEPTSSPCSRCSRLIDIARKLDKAEREPLLMCAHFFIPRRAEGATRVSQAVLKAKIQKLAESLESCTRALDELSEQLEFRVQLYTKSSRDHDLKISADRPTGQFF